MKKNLLYAAGVALVMTACSQAPSTDYNVEYNATAENNGLTAYLMDYDDKDVKLDSTTIVDGKAVFNGTIDAARIARLVINGKPKATFVLEAGNISIDSLGTAAGAPLNDAFEAFNNASDSLRKEYMIVAAKAKNDTTLLAQLETIQNEYTALEEATAAQNQGNPIGYYLFLQKAYQFDGAQLDSALAADSTLLQYKRVTKLVDAAKRKIATSAGNQFTDFEITHEGNTQRLSDYVGKGDYAIVDFWASWCGPCMREAETLKEIYKKWGGKGLEIVGVAVWDEPANSLKAIDDKKLTWKHIINGQNLPTDLYGISGIPCIVVVDPQGMIIARDVRGEDLKQLIDEKLSEKK